MLKKHKIPSGRWTPNQVCFFNQLGCISNLINNSQGKNMKTDRQWCCVPFGRTIPLTLASSTPWESTDRQKNKHQINAINTLQGSESEKEFLAYTSCPIVKMERHVSPSPSLPQALAPFPRLPPFSLSASLSLPFPAVSPEPHCSTPLTCRRSAILGPRAANPETCTWEAEGALRSPNQPSFLKEWETWDNEWRRQGGRAKENIKEWGGEDFVKGGGGKEDRSRGRGLGGGRGSAPSRKLRPKGAGSSPPEGVMGMMQTQPRSKSLALTRTDDAKEPPPGWAPPLVARTRGRRECKSYFARKKREKTRGA